MSFVACGRSIGATTTATGATTVTGATTLPSDCLVVPRPRMRVPTPCDADADLQRGVRVWKLNFESECRDTGMWPTPAAYRLVLPTVMRNVSSVKLESVTLQAGEYNVSSVTNTLDVEVTGTMYTATIAPGNYTTGAALATAVNTALTAAVPGTWSVTYTALTDTLTIAETGGPTPFTLAWRTGPTVNTSAWRQLGWPRIDVTTDATAVAVAPGRINLAGPTVVDVFVDELTKVLDGPVGRVQMKQQFADAPVFHTPPVETVHTFWPIARLTFFTFRFMVPYGRVDGDGSIVCDYRPYQFAGLNNSVRLDVACTTYVNPMECEVQLDAATT